MTEEKTIYGVLPRFRVVGDALMVRLSLVRQEGDSIRGCTGRDGYEDLTVHFYYYPEEDRCSEPEIGYADHYFADRRDLEVMVRTVRKIDRRIDKCGGRDLNVPSVWLRSWERSQVLARIIRATDAKFVARQMDNSGSANYSDHRWDMMAIHDGAGWILSQIECESKHCEPATIQ